MAVKMYVGNYGGPLTTEVYEADGVTPALPVSATIDIINMVSGVTVVAGGICTVASGLASYTIPMGSPVTATAGRYVGYMDVLLEVGNLQTNEIYLNVYEKASHLIIERWRAKVSDSAPTQDHILDDDAREWIDQAVGFIGGGDEGFTYTSVLASIDPAPTAMDLEFIASVASLLARRAWWAGKGTWRDDEMSYDARALQAEWDALQKYFTDIQTSGIYDAIEPRYATNTNRDSVYFRGRFLDEVWNVRTYYSDTPLPEL